jgi:hypothetical protein
VRGRIAIIVVTVLATSCGDCISIGSMSATVRARDAITGAAISLAGASLTATDSRGSETGIYDDMNNQMMVCCVTNQVRLELHALGYAAADTTIDVEPDRCGHAKHIVAVELRLRPSPLRASASE